MCRRSATSHNDFGEIPTVLSGVQPVPATVVPQQPPERAPEVHLVGMRGEVGVAGPLLASERLELGADELGGSDTVPAGLEVTKRPLLALARDGDAVLAKAPNPSRPRAGCAGQMGTKRPSRGCRRFARLRRGRPRTAREGARR